jgi:peptidoglycan/xylan/chitin deacetylase (PgdA/CDA1 family)
MTYRLSVTTHFLTIDVTDWTSDPDVAYIVARRNFDPLEARPAETVNALLDRLAATSSWATFFLTGPIARRDASLARRIVHSGHEVAARGAPTFQDYDAFRADARQVKSVIEDACGVPVRGFRSLVTAGKGSSRWRFETLVEEGYEYDSSRFPRARQGPLDQAVPSYPQTIVCDAGSLIEVPLLPQPFAKRAFSIRRTPYAAVQQVFASRTRAGLPGVVSFATWEVDHEQPKIQLPVLTSWRHYRGRRAAHDRVDRLLREFRFDAIGHRLSELAEQAPAAFTT